jgi:cell wall-associated NlpC family hydrolase
VAALPIAPNPRHWTAQMGQSVVDRALQWLGVPYAFAGGNAAGPTIGICGAGNSSNDCHVDGFDCSGLALYSWAPYLSLTHYAATQYVQAGKLHPSVSQLLPGDLVFWSSNATVTGIHHVGIYVGDANIIQAPQSGELVKITPLAAVDSGYYGATRPLS